MSPRTQKRERPNRAQKRQANRDRILTAARRVFGARGYEQATIEEIAEESGLSNGAIYYNFKNKEALFMALLDERMQERVEHARQALVVPGGPADLERALQDEARDVTRTLKESREWRLLLLEFVAYAARNPRFGTKLRQHNRELHAALLEILTQHLNARGVTPPMGFERLANVLAALLNGLAIQELTEPGTVPDDLFGDTLGLLLAEPAKRIA